MRRRAFIPHATLMRLDPNTFSNGDICQWFMIQSGARVIHRPNSYRNGIEIWIQDGEPSDQLPWDFVREELWDDGEPT